jgi:transcriptional regulator with PAS, ATPase and Fis domain
MRALVRQARRYAAVDATVLITGETGVGTDAFARFIHASGPRRKEPFVTDDCPALAETLVESELFGHERGDHHRPESSAQGALLRVVEERRVTRLGAMNATGVRARLEARPTLEDVERRSIEITLQPAKGNQTRAASILGISRKALWEKRKRCGLQ